MKFNLLVFALIVSLVLLAQPKKIRVHTLGDSTMEQQNPNTKPQRGWPQLLQPFFNDQILVVDPAKSGTSSKSYYNEGYWARAKKAIQPGDYVFIQFGHNDEKHDGFDGPIGTAPTDSFRIYLTRFVNEVRALGANPILFTPVVRNMFGTDGKVGRRGRHDLGEMVFSRVDKTFDVRDTVRFNYPFNMIQVAKQLNCPLVDMTELSRHLVDSLGQKKATELIYNLPKDGTHFGTSGALLLSSLAAKELRSKKILSNYLLQAPSLMVPNKAVSFGTVYVGTNPIQVFDVCYLGTVPTDSKINLKAPRGFSIATKPDGPFSKSLSLAAASANGFSAHTLYAKATPTKLGSMSGFIHVTDQNHSQKISLVGECKEIKDNQKAVVTYKLSGHPFGENEGAVTAFNEVWKGMELSGYQAPKNLNIDGGALSLFKMQRSTIQGGVWPTGEMDVDYSRYIQFGLKVADGTELMVDSIGFYSGDEVTFRVVSSLTPDFSNTTTLGEKKGSNSKTLVSNSFKTNQKVNSGGEFYIRIYPWCTESTPEQYLLLHEVAIRGFTRLLEGKTRH